MKIGFINQPWDNLRPPHVEGSITLITWEFARRLARSSHVSVCISGSPGDPAHERWEGIQFHRFRLTPDNWLLERPRRACGVKASRKEYIASSLYYAVYALRSARRLNADACNIIHIHNFSQFLPITRLFNRRAKIVLHMNCDWLAQFDWELTNRRLRHADAIIGCADYITDHVKVRFPNYAERCATLYNGADVNNFAPSPERTTEKREGKRFIFAGRVSPEKGVHVLLDAFKSVVAREPEAELKILGGAYIPPLSFIVEQSSDPVVRGLSRFYNSDYMEELRGQAAATLGDRVSFVGFVPHSELGTFLTEADVFVQPSVWGEPFPLAVLEAMAARLPVVASRTGGLAESVVDGRTGLLVEPNNPAVLADAMLRLIRDKKKAQNMGAAGEERARELFSWDVLVGRLTGIYNALVSGSPIASLSANAA
jgi:glycosyltransferase involved in cell wall biosynthesis